MYEVLLTVVVKPGCESRFERLAVELRAATLERDPGCRRYDWYRGANERCYLVFESWTDEDCILAHSRSSHLLTLLPQLEQCVERGFEVQTLTSIG
jgi:quinol monooxygenase YgiN